MATVDLQSLDNLQLRELLKKYGKDVPTAVEKSFMIRLVEKEMSGSGGGRRSMGPATPTRVPVAGRRSETPQRRQPETPQRRERLSQPAMAPITRVEENGFEEEEDEEEEEEESENENEEKENAEEPSHITPSPRYQKYLSYFKGNSNMDPFTMPRTTYNSPIGSPFSTAATAGSPSFRGRSSLMYDDSGDESDVELPPTRQSKVGNILSRVNPVNWKWWALGRKTTDAVSPSQGNQLNFNFGSGGRRAGDKYSSSSSSASPSSSEGANGNFSFGSPSTSTPTTSRANLANQIYSPASPPTQQPRPKVPPAVTSTSGRRHSGFSTLFSRGERNGVNQPNSRPKVDKSHLIPTMLVFAFTIAALAVFGAYYYKTYYQPSGLTGLGEDLKDYIDHNEKSRPPGSPPTEVTPKPKRQAIISKLKYPICGTPGFEEQPCVSKTIIRDSKTLFEALRTELTQRSKHKSCGGGVEDKVSLKTAKDLLYRLANNVNKESFDAAFTGMLLMTLANPNTGMRIEQSGLDRSVTPKDIDSLNQEDALIFMEGVSPAAYCLVVGLVMSFFAYALYFSLVGAVGYGCYRAMKYWKGRKAREDEEMFNMIDRVVALLQEHYEVAKNTGDDQFIPVKHIRDQLLSARERKQKENLWSRVVNEISTNESRVREEIREISGEDFRVWRWLQSASPLTKQRMSMAGGDGRGRTSMSASPNLYPNLRSMAMTDPSGSGQGQWQGQAFEMMDGGPNALAQPPTTCLKIRQMYESSTDVANNRIEQAILDKCNSANILHIGIDHTTREGCVYIRCQTKNDAKAAYGALHGWWFDGHLLSVKFLREDRYLTRFPEAMHKTTPLRIDNIRANPGVHPLSGQQSFNNNINRMHGGTSPNIRFVDGD